MKPSASKTRTIALSIVLSAANVVVVVSIVRSTAWPDSVSLVLALVVLSGDTLAQVWRNAVA